MILRVHRDTYFDERVKQFLLHGGTASLAARKAEDIIEKIVRDGKKNGYYGYKVGRQSRNGELRIRNCIKYDLGNGYRMVCLIREHRFVCLYIGTHDECSRWIERNKGLEYDLNHATCTMIEVRDVSTTEVPNEPDPADVYEEELLKKLDDATLRKIFCGICERGSVHSAE